MHKLVTMTTECRISYKNTKHIDITEQKNPKIVKDLKYI
jgi:hypothetical protein